MAARFHKMVSTTEPVVGFEADGWMRYLTLHGDRAFVLGGSWQPAPDPRFSSLTVYTA